MREEHVARAIACFEASDDLQFLLQVVREVRTKAAAAMRELERSGRQAPPPAVVPAASQAATREEALRTVRATRDFGWLQALARAAGRRAEALAGNR